MKKLFLFLVTAAILSVLLTYSVKVVAQDDQPPQPNEPNLVDMHDELHARLARKAIEELPQTAKDEMLEVLWQSGDYDGKPAVVAGAYEEDHIGWPLNPPGYHHSWKPDTNGFWRSDTINSSRGTALDWADFYFRNAVELYRQGEGSRIDAYFALGRAVHLLGDVATPAHVLLDEHISYWGIGGVDSYEHYTRNFPAPDGVEVDYRVLRSNIPEALEDQKTFYNSTGGVSDSRDYLWSYGPINYTKMSREDNIRVNADLFHIFYDTAEFADNRRSDDVEGEGCENNRCDATIVDPWYDDASIADEDLEKYQEDLLPRSVGSINSLLQLFWDTTHSPIEPLDGCNSNVLPANDDGSTVAIPLPFNLNYFGNTYGALFVNNNGNVTFDSSLSTYTPFPLSSTNRVIIAPFFADVDTRTGSEVTYGEVLYGSNRAFCVNWDDVGVGYYTNHIDKLNGFQLLLVDRSDVNEGDFDIYMNYDRIEWETGDASGGSGGLGGSSARVGYSNGSTTSFELPGSGVNGAFLDTNTSSGLIHNSRNSLMDGRFIYEVRSGTPPEEGTISGVVSGGVSSSPQPLIAAFVQACNSLGSCNTTTTNAFGEYTIIGLAAGDYTVTAFPPSDHSNLGPGTIGPLSLATGQTLSGQDILLSGPTAPPEGTTITSISTTPEGVPVVNWNQDLTLTTQGCANGTASFEVIKDGNVISSGGMVETPVGSGNYEAVISPLTPNTGVAEMEISIVCLGGTDELIEFDIYIDPSGVVQDQNGDAVAGATMTLYRSDSSIGPFVVVPDGSAIMSPSNRSNPSITDSEGHFGWDVIAGYYKVKAEKIGCVSPDNPELAFVETEVMTIPPPVTDVVLVMQCSGSITIIKDTNPAGATGFGFTGDLGPFTLDDGQSKVVEELTVDDFVVNETNSIGWDLDSVDCDSENVTTSGSGVTIHLAAGENISCTFVNQRLSVTAEAGGPYTGDEGTSIALDASGTTNKDMISEYNWDCTADGTYDKTSSSPTDSACTYEENGVYTVRLQTIDIFSQTSTDTAQVTVDNVAPSVDAGADKTVFVGENVNFTVAITDPGIHDTHSAEWDFGDGSTKESGLDVAHTFTAPGEYTVNVTVEDDDGGVGQETIKVVVTKGYLYLPMVVSP